MDAILRLLLENDFIVGLAQSSGAWLGGILAELLGPLLGSLMG